MKLLKPTLLLALVIALISCSKDDDNNNDSYDFKKDNLIGKYQLQSYNSKLVKTVNVEGGNVVTTTTSVGDTFDFSYDFASDNKVTKNGTYRISETKTQNIDGSQPSDTTYIVNIDNEKVNYSVNAGEKELTISGSTYKVSNFTPTGFKLNLTETTTEDNGDKQELTKELQFSK